MPLPLDDARSEHHPTRFLRIFTTRRPCARTRIGMETETGTGLQDFAEHGDTPRQGNGCGRRFRAVTRRAVSACSNELRGGPRPVTIHAVRGVRNAPSRTPSYRARSTRFPARLRSGTSAASRAGPAPPAAPAKPAPPRESAMAEKGTPRSAPRPPADRRAWVAPRVEELPRLTELTLQTGLIGGECGVGGSTCF